MIEIFYIFFSAFGLGIPLTLFSKWLGFRTGMVVEPRPDRWHKSPTPVMGGLGIFLSTSIVLLLFGLRKGADLIDWTLMVPPAIMFVVGIWDDIKPLNASHKLIMQITAAILFVNFGGYVIRFFPWPFANVLLSIFWIVGITNAINLLDNMDGLGAGVSLIAALFLAVLTWQAGDFGLMVIAVGLSGSLLAFLLFNFPPAKIFMGDSGSLFIGFTLAMLSVARRTSASNVLAVLGVPILVFLLPILDTGLVSLTRLLRGISPTEGGKDHTSHRLVSFGLDEKRVIWVLYFAAFLSGTAGYVLESFDYDLSLALVPIFLVIMLILTVYLGRITVIDPKPERKLRGKFWQSTNNLYIRVFEMLLDLVLVGICYYLAFWVREGFDMTALGAELYLRSWPVALMSVYLLNLATGVYRINWNTFGYYDVLRNFVSSIAAGLVTYIICVLVIPNHGYSLGLFVLFSFFIFGSLTSTRSSFRFIELLIERGTKSIKLKPDPTVETVFIYGKSSHSDILLRWLEAKNDLTYRILGLIDDDRRELGREIRGFRILGSLDDVPRLVRLYAVKGIIVSTPGEEDSVIKDRLKQYCQDVDIWVRVIQVNFDVLEI